MGHRTQQDLSTGEYKIPDPGDGKSLVSTEWGTTPIVTGSSGQTRTMPNPDREGLLRTIYFLTDGGGDCVVTVASAFDAAGNTTFTLANVGEYVTFQSIAYGTGFRWRLVASNVLSVLSGLTATVDELNAVADLSVNGAVVKTKVISITATPTGSEQDTTWDLPAKAIVRNVFVDVTTAEATGTTKTLDIGTLSGESGGDADGFVDGVDVSSTGVKQVSLVSGAVTRGVLLKETVTGSGSATHSSPRDYSASANTARSISYTAGSNNFAEFRGKIIIEYIEIN